MGNRKITGLTHLIQFDALLSSFEALSRIYAGFQFRNDVEAGDKMGRELARFIYFRKFRDI